MSDNLEIAAKLDEARALIEKGWTQGCTARDEQGRQVEAESNEATSFCAIGSLFRVGAYDLCYAPLHQVMGGMVGFYNDTHSQAEVIDAFKKAAALARGETA